MFYLDDLSAWPTDEQLQKAVAKNDAIAQAFSNLNPNGADFAENLRSLQIKIGNRFGQDGNKETCACSSSQGAESFRPSRISSPVDSSTATS